MEDASFMRSILNLFCKNSPNFIVIASKNRVLYANSRIQNLFGELRCIHRLLPNYLHSTQKNLIKKIILPNNQRLIIRLAPLTTDLFPKKIIRFFYSPAKILLKTRHFDSA